MNKLAFSRDVRHSIIFFDHFDGDDIFYTKNIISFHPEEIRDFIEDGITYTNVGRAHVNCFKCDEVGEPVELVKGEPKLYKLWIIYKKEDLTNREGPEAVGYEIEEQ